jgi:hypothetical protein
MAKFQGPPTGKPLISTISAECKTPVLEIKYSNIIMPFYYPNSPNIPRYSVTCYAEPVKHKNFLASIQAIEKNEGVASILKADYKKEEGELVTTGKVIVKFQTKDHIPIFIEEDGEVVPYDLKEELQRGEKISVVYDILRYTKKNSLDTEHALSFKPTAIYYYPTET